VRLLLQLKEILNGFKQSSIKCYFIYIKFDINYNINELNVLLQETKQIAKITIHSIPKENIEDIVDVNNTGIKYTTKRIKSRAIERPSLQGMVLNVTSYSEAKKFNLGLNRKVSIDSEGNIKNHLTHEKSYGKIRINYLDRIVGQKSFQAKWFIGHDKIEICKVCQYRYMCVDNTDIKKINKKYTKIFKCKFNPYTNIWSETL